MAFMDNEVWIDNTATPLALAGESCLHLWLQMTDHRAIHNIVKQDEYRSDLALVYSLRIFFIEFIFKFVNVQNFPFLMIFL